MVSIIQTAVEDNELTDEADATEELFIVFEQMWDISEQFSDMLDSEFARKPEAKGRGNHSQNNPPHSQNRRRDGFIRALPHIVDIVPKVNYTDNGTGNRKRLCRESGRLSRSRYPWRAVSPTEALEP